MKARTHYFEPGTRVWVHVDKPGLSGRYAATIDCRQNGVYRVIPASGEPVLVKSGDVSLRRA